MTVPSPSRCRSCEAPIRWATATATGRRMPLDAEPTADGNVTVHRGDDGQAVATVHPIGTPIVGTRWRPHWATCPNADQHRQPPAAPAAAAGLGASDVYETPAGQPGGVVSCPGCGRPIIPTVNMATGWGMVLDAELIPTVDVLDGKKPALTPDGNPVRAAASVGYHLIPGGATLALAAGPDGNAGAGVAHELHRCGRTGGPEVVAVRQGDGQLAVHGCGAAVVERLHAMWPDGPPPPAEALARLAELTIHVYLTEATR
ncbi:hypothetical protein [Frankia sp. AvcI1]|uniref:hypothetical protein n=1 Tax=Frankia sp. AvcI1 TaxID=573496 RepID=UPI0021176C31|nr:hypothetical protein [Frankia sp. AvcI1]